jgi:hydroxypyruvate reductase
LSRWLLASGLDIDAMNRVRQAVSLIKGGRLLRFLAGRPTSCLLISDVPGDDPAVIGSGPLVPRPDHELPPGLPDWVMAWVERADDRQRGAGVLPELAVVARLEDAKQAAAEAARAQGFEVTVHPGLIDGEPEAVADRAVAELTRAAPGVQIWGGETTPRLPDEPGRGGRNQHLALAAAVGLAGRDDAWLLAAGTDGTDGPTEDAGALVDGGTVDRGRLEGLDPQDCLRRADAGRFLEASGDLLRTGPTGTNVMDLIIGLRLEEGRR